MRRLTYDSPRSATPTAIKWLLIANLGVFVVQNLLGAPFAQFFGLRIESVFGLRPSWIVERGWAWQGLTYMFLHGGLFHLLFNMFMLWMFGADVEHAWGRSRFLHYYFMCGLAAALASFVTGYDSLIIGASGAVLGVLVAFAMLFPDRRVFIWFLFPVRAKYLVLGLAGIELMYLMSQPGDGIAHAAHVGGMLAGYAQIRWGRTRGATGLGRWWRRRKLKVVDGGADKDRRAVEAEIDRILDKISEHGLESLTPEEARLLDEASRRH